MMNEHLLVPAIAWAIAQTAKVVINARKGRADLSYFYRSGGMPSSHTATIVALLTTSLILDGFDSNLFGVVSIVALIVIYDALNVRRAVGEHREVLKVLVENQPKQSTKLKGIQLYESLGHKPAEVVWGGLLGFATAALLLGDYWLW